ncbi:hypothetical protein FHX73_113928 [Kitasatospora viridis]|uniref:Uncharacterized protein n=2 Tax=Kitasatospora viridis TaxID=281105 RepID=A0A561UL23_9ACTN|nr:hypothetical protein FHX73_113928 [Kitasatospora viridis]
MPSPSPTSAPTSPPATLSSAPSSAPALPTATYVPPTVTLQPSSEAPAGTGAGGQCSIRSNAGNCYSEGEFCRKSDVGQTTTDAAGRPITCEYLNGESQPHWH